jgi:hypothetical protein
LPDCPAENPGGEIKNPGGGAEHLDRLETYLTCGTDTLNRRMPSNLDATAIDPNANMMLASLLSHKPAEKSYTCINYFFANNG